MCVSSIQSITGCSCSICSYTAQLFFSSSKAFRFPLTLPGDWTEHELHGDSVTQMRLSFDDKRLVTTGRDGSLCIWKVGERERERNDVWG